MSLPDDLRRMQAELGAVAPDPVVYLVLDHAVAPGVHLAGRDARGRRFMRVSPSVMDAARHVKYGGFTVAEIDAVAPIFAMQVFRLEDLPAGWPEV